MSETRYDINTELGGRALEVIAKSFPGPAHMVLIVLPHDDDGEPGQPSFLSTLEPEAFRQLIIELAEFMPDNADGMAVKGRFTGGPVQ